MMINHGGPLVEAEHGPAAEEHRGTERRCGERVTDVHSVKQAPLHTGVLGQVTGDDFRLGFSDVRGCAVQLGADSDEVDDEGKRLEEDQPDVVVLLEADHGVQIERATEDDGAK
jgi:hypothetical protein